MGVSVFRNAHEWRLNTKDGSVQERVLNSSLGLDFPVVDPALTGKKTRFGYAAVFNESTPAQIHGVAKVDLDSGELKVT